MAILRAGKCDTDDSQILAIVKNRGGLWLVTENGQKRFENVEQREYISFLNQNTV